jgi:hypothetical protein
MLPAGPAAPGDPEFKFFGKILHGLNKI